MFLSAVAYRVHVNEGDHALVCHHGIHVVPAVAVLLDIEGQGQTGPDALQVF